MFINNCWTCLLVLCEHLLIVSTSTWKHLSFPSRSHCPPVCGCTAQAAAEGAVEAMTGRGVQTEHRWCFSQGQEHFLGTRMMVCFLRPNSMGLAAHWRALACSVQGVAERGRVALIPNGFQCTCHRFDGHCLRQCLIKHEACFPGTRKTTGTLREPPYLCLKLFFLPSPGPTLG